MPFREAFTDRHRACFDSVKEALTSAPVLRLPDCTQPFEVVADASLNGTGAVLMQEGHPIAYFSKKFSPAERNYTTGEQELLAVHCALAEWRCYLEGPELTLVTDHNPLTYLDSQAMLSRKQARCMEFLSRFNYKWLYRPGRQNVADPVPRNPALFNAITAVGNELPSAPSIVQEILSAYGDDHAFLDAKYTAKFAQAENGLWMRPGKVDAAAPCVVVPNSKRIRTRIISELHSTYTSRWTPRSRTYYGFG